MLQYSTKLDSAGACLILTLYNIPALKLAASTLINIIIVTISYSHYAFIN